MYANDLSENLQNIIKHFYHNPKSSEMLALELNKIHFLNWECTHMAGLLDTCMKASNIILPFLDTLVTS